MQQAIDSESLRQQLFGFNTEEPLVVTAIILAYVAADGGILLYVIVTLIRWHRRVSASPLSSKIELRMYSKSYTCVPSNSQLQRIPHLVRPNDKVCSACGIWHVHSMCTCTCMCSDLPQLDPFLCVPFLCVPTICCTRTCYAQVYHLFLSYHWTNQDAVISIERELTIMLPWVRLFLDVNGDLESLADGELENHVRRSCAMLVLLGSPEYFQSKNCMRELNAARHSCVPLILMHESDVEKGGAPLQDLIEVCPAEHRAALFGREHAFKFDELDKARVRVHQSVVAGTLRSAGCLDRGRRVAFNIDGCADQPNPSDMVCEHSSGDGSGGGNASNGADVSSGGGSMGEEDETEALPPLIPWYRLRSFQRSSLRLLAEAMLWTFPAGVDVSEHHKFYLPDELINLYPHFHGQTGAQVYFSKHNRGADVLVRELIDYFQIDSPVRYRRATSVGERLHQGFQSALTASQRHSAIAANGGPTTGGLASVSARPLAAERHRPPALSLASEAAAADRSAEQKMLLLLRADTFDGVAGEQLAHELYLELSRGRRMLLVHVNDEASGGCAFDKIMKAAFRALPKLEVSWLLITHTSLLS